MKKTFNLTGFIFLVVLFSIRINSGDFKLLGSTDKSIPNIVDGIRYESGNWLHPDYGKPFRTFGNHRFVLKVNEVSDVVRARIHWRRADEDPASKGIVIVNAKSGNEINNIFVVDIDNEYGDLLFKPDRSSSTYFLYYLPYESTGGYYPKVKYLPRIDTADREWLGKYGNIDESNLKNFPEVEVVAAQSIDSFNSFFPMEIIAGQKEVENFLRSNPHKFYLFPEFRENPIKMSKYLPLHWVKRKYLNGISENVKRGEFFTFQVGVYSPDHELSDVKVEFKGLRSDTGEEIKETGLECFNTSGVDLNGKFFAKNLKIEKSSIQSLWFGIDVPSNLTPGKYNGKVVITPEGFSSEVVVVELNIVSETINNHGDNSPENMSRLRWLNSRLGDDKDFIVKPFSPVIIKGKSLAILGRSIKIGRNGLPDMIGSYFSEKMTSLSSKSQQVLSGPVSFEVKRKNCRSEEWGSDSFRIKQNFKSEAHWSVKNRSDSFVLNTDGILEYDGMLNYKLKLTARHDVDVSDIILKIPMKYDASKYMVGLGKKGGQRPKLFSWKWDVNFHQEGVWLGNINKGLQYVLRDENYERPLNTNFYHNKPLKLPVSWGNEGKGGIRIRSAGGKTVIAENYSGSRKMKKGDVLHFNVRFLITPFKPIDLKKHFQTRFVHKYLPVDEVSRLGGTVVNVHHATEINPYINYPFFNLDKQKAYIESAHKKGIKVKLYNTIRELTYKAYELFALKSLGDEIFNDGSGGGHSWLQEHLRSNYHSAWHATNVNDAAILDKGTSRWTNYYIEGLNWLAKNQKIDGLYLDDISFSRETVKRIVTVLNKQRKDIIIDLHSANQFNQRDGYINSVFLYMEHIPYISRLWFGEYFEYDQGPDYWLTEVSGIPFGLTGEMLEKGGHPFRGMVYGMTTRVYGKYNPGELWKLFDEFNIMESEMFGYWVKGSPVTTSVKKIRSTIYKRENSILIAIGSWSPEDELVKLNIDWNSVAFKKENAILYAPEVKGLQKSRKLDISDPVIIEKQKGMILILKKKKD